MRHAGGPRSPTSRPWTPRWHLSKQGHVVIDCPKMAEALWPAAFQPPRALAAAPEPSPVEQTGGVGGAVVAAEVEVAAREPAAAACEGGRLAFCRNCLRTRYGSSSNLADEKCGFWSRTSSTHGAKM